MTADTRNSSSSSISSSNSNKGSSINSSYSRSKNNVPNITNNLQHIHIENKISQRQLNPTNINVGVQHVSP